MSRKQRPAIEPIARWCVDAIRWHRLRLDLSVAQCARFVKWPTEKWHRIESSPRVAQNTGIKDLGAMLWALGLAFDLVEPGSIMITPIGHPSTPKKAVAEEAK